MFGGSAAGDLALDAIARVVVVCGQSASDIGCDILPVSRLASGNGVPLWSMHAVQGRSSARVDP